MAIYRPDPTLIKAQKLIDKLGDSENDMLIKYYIEEKNQHIERQSTQIQEYANFFKTLDRFLPNRNPVFG